MLAHRRHVEDSRQVMTEEERAHTGRLAQRRREDDNRHNFRPRR